jgi:serpin B
MDAAVEAARLTRRFAVSAFQHLAVGDSNVAWSPYSVVQALAMLRPGARGRTAAEIDAVLQLPEAKPEPEPEPEHLSSFLGALNDVLATRSRQPTPADPEQAALRFETANALWGHLHTVWDPAYPAAIERDFGAAMQLVDYRRSPAEITATINGWTAERTHGRIPAILPPGVVTAITRLVLVSAVYLQAPWHEPFSAARTGVGPFTRADGSEVEVPVMHASLHHASVAEGEGWVAARLPLIGGAVAMTIVLPDGSVDEFVRSLTAETFEAVLTSTRRVATLQVALPRWTFRYASSLNDTLAALGMGLAFTDSADFSGMSATDRLTLSAVLHEAFIAVDEAGIEAAAATASIAILASAAYRPAAFVVDRPFVFVVHDVETATPLFLGAVADPLAT